MKSKKELEDKGLLKNIGTNYPLQNIGTSKVNHFKRNYKKTDRTI